MMKKKLLACKNCGKKRRVTAYQEQLPTYTGLCVTCSSHSRGRENNPNWQGGRFKNNLGYIDVRLYPEDPYYLMATTAHHYCREHRYIVARYLGRVLTSDEWVHHLNGIKDDNRIENLRLKTPSQHLKEHTRGYQDGYKQGYQDGLIQIRKEWGIKK